MVFIFLLPGETYHNIKNIINKSAYIIPLDENRIYINFRSKKYVLNNNDDGLQMSPVELRRFREDFPLIKINQVFHEGTITEKFVPSYQFLPPYPRDDRWTAYLLKDNTIIGFVSGQNNCILFVEINILYRGKGFGKIMISSLFSKLLSIYHTFYLTNEGGDISKNCYIKCAKMNKLNVSIDGDKLTFTK